MNPRNGELFTADYEYPLVIGNLDCLRDSAGNWRDCFSSDCFDRLLKAVEEKGTCDVKDNPALNSGLNVTWGINSDFKCKCVDATTDCTAATHENYQIETGSCDDACTAKLYEPECITELKRLPTIIQNTIREAIL